jgi:phosphoribosyl 1,2-cyclic phosphate phosphodiesterase
MNHDAKTATRENKTNSRFVREIPGSRDQAGAMSKWSVTILGSGTSQGVPMIGCPCAVCASTDPRDQRTRSSIFIATPEANLLVDATPELRVQALREKLNRVDAVLFTHAHADHIMGFDDLRRFCDLRGGALPIYGSPETLGQLQRIFYYAFDPKKTVPGYVHVTPHVVTKPFELGGLAITPLPVPHGAVSTYGYLFSRGGRRLFAYLSDCQSVPADVAETLRGVEVLIIDGLRDLPHPTHLNVSGAIEVAREIGARQAYLTHQTHDKTHAERERGLPTGVGVVYDGMKLELDWP